MKTVAFLLCLALVAVASAEDDYERFLVTVSTTTEISTSTSTSITTPTAYCIANSPPVTACRKRRGIDENSGTEVDSINPTGTFAIEPSRPAHFMPAGTNAVPSIESSKDKLEVKISGLNNACQGRMGGQFTTNWDPNLNITVISTTSSTTTVTETSTAPTTTKTMKMNCTPQGFTYSLCA